MRHTTAKGWKLRVLLGGALCPVLLGSGCQSMNNTDKGMLEGGVLGGVIGALAAGPRHAGAGALVGGAIGAVAGGLAGNSVDKSQQRAAAQAAAMARPALSLEDIDQLTKNGTSDDVIITQIRNTGSVYYLGAEHLIWLQNAGVHEVVIREMQATASRPRAIYAGVPVQPVYVVDPAPPPVGVGVGVAVVGGRRW